MLFNSYHFLIFFPLVVLMFYIVPRKWRTIWLLAASYYFYMGWNPKYAAIILLCTVVTWLGGRWMSAVSENGRAGRPYQKLILLGCCAVTLGILCFFKYARFIWDSVAALAGGLQMTMGEMPLRIVLPVGISFYTFQALSYVIDVYRNQVPVQKSFLKYALFVSFFPQLVAGPIERSDHLLAQVEQIEEMSFQTRRIVNGLIYMQYGFFLKLVLADNLAVYVDHIFERYFFYGSVELFLAAVGFAFQIYCDFSSYSAIAIGAAMVMGFELMENFHAPYFASSIQEFWRRWHISLSSWFRDYVYIPLGGSHCSKRKYYLNLFLTFLVSGLWHGANWTFILWGVIHGLYQIIGGMLRPLKARLYPCLGIKMDSVSYHMGKILSTFLLTTFAWIFFRADSVRTAFLYIYNLFTKWNFWVLTDGSLKNTGFYNGVEWMVVLSGLIVLMCVDFILHKRNIRIDAFLEAQGNFFRMLVVGLLFLSTLIFGNYGGYEANAFIYFQF